MKAPLILLIVSVLIFSVMSGSVSAKDLYVDQNSTYGTCSDTYTWAQNDINNPWCTIGAANTLHQSGDHVYIMPGEYREVILPKSGSSGQHTTYLGYGNPSEVIIKGSDQVTGWTQCNPGVDPCTSTNVYYADFAGSISTRSECFVGAEEDEPNCPPAPQCNSCRWDYRWRCENFISTDCWQNETNWFLRADQSIDRFNSSLGAESIDQQGKYYFDYPNSKVYIWPFNDIDPNTNSIECSVRKVARLVGGANSAYITIQNLTIMHSFQDGVLMYSLAQDVNILNNIIKYNSGLGSCRENPAGVIHHGPPDATEQPHINIIGNEIYEQGSDLGPFEEGIQHIHGGAGIEFYKVKDSIVANNYVYNTSSGILLKRWMDNITTVNNTIYNFGGGGIIFLGNNTNMTIEGNTIHNSHPARTEASGIMWRGGLSFYESNDIIIRQNTIYNVPRGIFMDFAIQGYNCSYGVSSGHFIQNNIFYNISYEMLTRQNSSPSNYTSDYNLFYDDLSEFLFKAGDCVDVIHDIFTLNFSEWQTFTGGTEGNSTLANSSDPQIFVDEINYDFHLQSGSPAIDNGTFIPGYHCDLSDDELGGPEQTNCRHWSGLAPDIGVFEFVTSAGSECENMKPDWVWCADFDNLTNCVTGREVECWQNNGGLSAEHSSFMILPNNDSAVGPGVAIAYPEPGAVGTGYTYGTLPGSYDAANMRFYLKFGKGRLSFEGGHGPAIVGTGDGGCYMGGTIEIHPYRGFLYRTNSCFGGDMYAVNLYANQPNLPILENNRWYLWEVQYVVDTTCTNSSDWHGCNGIIRIWIDEQLVLEYTDINHGGVTHNVKFDWMNGPRNYYHRRNPYYGEGYDSELVFDNFVIAAGNVSDPPYIGPADNENYRGDGDNMSPYINYVGIEPFVGHHPRPDCTSAGAIGARGAWIWRSGGTFQENIVHGGFLSNCPGDDVDKAWMINLSQSGDGGGAYFGGYGDESVPFLKQHVLHGWVYLPSGNDYSNNPALAGFGGYSGSDGAYGSYVAMTVDNGKWALIQRDNSDVPQIVATSQKDVSFDEWHEFEIIVWRDQNATLMVDRERLFEEMPLPLTVDRLFPSSYMVVGVIDFVGTPPFIAYYDDINIGSASFWSCDGWGTSCPFTTQVTCHDVNTDGVVNIIDLVLVIYWQNKNSGDADWNNFDHLDVNNDTVINFADVSAVISDFGQSC